MGRGNGISSLVSTAYFLGFALEAAFALRLFGLGSSKASIGPAPSIIIGFGFG
jgi:hypothetical protein